MNNLSVKELVGLFRFEKWLKFIVITGGPCGGKSTFLKMAVDLLKKHRIRAFVIPEVARELIAAGFHPVNSPWVSSSSFQELVFMTILEKEATYFNALKRLNLQGEPVVFLCDRGLIDGKAYMNELSFGELLESLGVSHAEVLDRYTGVVSLVSAANGAEQFYVTDGERHESLEEARVLDTKTTAAWHQHLHLSVVDNSTSFPEKINRALLALNRLLNLSMQKEIEKKYLVGRFSLEQIPTGAKSFEILQIYLDRPDRPGIECRVRRKITEGSSSYYYTEKIPTSTEGVRGESEEHITEARFDELKHLYPNSACKPIEKTRYKFQEGSYVLELDVFHGQLNGLVTLEVEFPDEAAMTAFVPPSHFFLTDLAGNERYSNRMLAEYGKPMFQ